MPTDKPLIEHPATQDVVREFLAGQINDLRAKQEECGSADIDEYLKLEGMIDALLSIWLPLLGERNK
jgi:hypothetical protein